MSGEEDVQSKALRSQVEALSRTNATVHYALVMAEREQCTYEEALQMAVIQLAAIADAHQKTLIEFATRSPFPFLAVGAK